MSAPVRFAFDKDFALADGADGQDDAATRLRREIEAVAYARGFDDGRSSEEAAATRRLAEAGEAISAELADTEAMLEARFCAIEQEAAALALSFAQNLTLGLVPDTALVERAFGEALKDLTGALALSVTLNPRVLPHAGERLAAMASGVNPNARLRLVSDRAMPPGDCTIDWPEGAIAACRATREQRLAALIARAFPQTPSRTDEPKP